MTKESRRLRSLLQQREEQLWQLQNAALQLTTEGPSPELCGTLADAIEELRKHLVESGLPALSELLANMTVLLRVGRLDRTETEDVFALVEALVSVQRGEGEAALQSYLEARQKATGPERPPAPQPAQVLVDRTEDVDPDDIRMFSAEAHEHVQFIEACLIELEATRNLDLVGEIFRGVHSIKGGAQYLGLEATATLAHRTETLLDRLRSKTLGLSSAIVTLLLRSVDVLSALVDALDQGNRSDADVAALVGELETAIAGRTAPETARTPIEDLRVDEPILGDEHFAEPLEPAVSTPEEMQALAAEPWEEVESPPSKDTAQPPEELPDVELFAAEFRANMQSARELLSDMQALVGAPEKIAVVSRNLHSLKGLAGLVGIAEIERIAGALDSLVSRVFRHRQELPPDVSRAVGAGLGLLEEVFVQHQTEGAVTFNVDEHVSIMEELAAREGRLIEWDAVDPWESLLPEPGGSPMADRYADLVRALRADDVGAIEQSIDSLAGDASMQGCDELATSAEALRGAWRGYSQEALRDHLLKLRDLVPADLASWRAPAATPQVVPFEDAVLSVPGIGRKKLRRLVEAGIDSREAVQAAGLQGLIAVPGINIEQAKMLLFNCAGTDARMVQGSGKAEPSSPPLDQQILEDDYDRHLVEIYLETTTQQVDMVRARLREGQLDVAQTTLSDLVGAARYMGYSTLRDTFTSAQDTLASDPAAIESCDVILSSIRVNIERLRQQVVRLREGSPTAPPTDTEVKELERIFAESAEAHLNRIRHDLPSFLAGMDETLLSSLQHHLSCLHSAATNIGREDVVAGAEKLQARIEDLWLAPQELDAQAATQVWALLRRLFESCGHTPPEDEAPPFQAGRGIHPLPHGTAPEEDLDSAFSRIVADEPPAPDVSSPILRDEPTPGPSAHPAGPSPTAPQPNSGGDGQSARPASSRLEPAAAEITSGLVHLQDAETIGPDAAEASRSLVEAQATVRVDTSKIDDLMNMVAELVVNRSAFMVVGTTVNDIINRLIDSGQLGKVEARDLRTVLTRHDEAMTELGRVSNQLQQGVMRIRMMPVRTLFSRVPRLVRDLAMREGRQAKVFFSGEDTELDKTVIERLSDPLVHLIRNAISHGLESPEERVAAGKPAEGRILISARHQGNIVIIEVEDDGRGIDFEKIRQRWAETGLGSAAQVARLTTRELLAALFLPGFSTAQTVTDVSGRGVGLDVVKRNIENLGGQVDVATEAGRFCRFTIRIPLTMAIMQALLVRVASETYAIPVSAVIQAEKITRDQIYSVENQKVITIRGSVIPLVELTDIFAYNYYLETGQAARSEPDATANGNGESKGDAVYVVVLQGEGREIGIVVNGLVGSQDIVIKSLEDELVDARGVAGASILGDGTVTLILDAGEIQKMVVDGQHSEEMRRSETMRRLERYVREHGYLGPERSIH